MNLIKSLVKIGFSVSFKALGLWFLFSYEAWGVGSVIAPRMNCWQFTPTGLLAYLKSGSAGGFAVTGSVTSRCALACKLLGWTRSHQPSEGSRMGSPVVMQSALRHQNCKCPFLFLFPLFPSWRSGLWHHDIYFILQPQLFQMPIEINRGHYG